MLHCLQILIDVLIEYRKKEIFENTIRDLVDQEQLSATCTDPSLQTLANLELNSSSVAMVWKRITSICTQVTNLQSIQEYVNMLPPFLYAFGNNLGVNAIVVAMHDLYFVAENITVTSLADHPTIFQQWYELKDLFQHLDTLKGIYIKQLDL